VTPTNTHITVTGAQPTASGNDDPVTGNAHRQSQEDTTATGSSREEHSTMPAEAAANDTANDAESNKSPLKRVGGIAWQRIVAYSVLPGLALLLALGAGFLKWQDSSVRQTQESSLQAVKAAAAGTVALLSYGPDTAEKDLTAASNLMTLPFRNDYNKLIHDVVIPGAKQKQISARANVVAAGSISASVSHAIVLLFVDQTVTVGGDPPTDSASSVRITLDKVRDRWMISQFEPV
jgi:Mce-associated membrane protein